MFAIRYCGYLRTAASLSRSYRAEHATVFRTYCSRIRPNLEFSPQAFDLVVIGSGPAGQKCAIDAAKRGKQVAVVDFQKWWGGVCVHTGTVPSKTFREAVLHLTGYRNRGFYGRFQLGKTVTVKDIMHRVARVEKTESQTIRNQLVRNGVTLLDGHARFIDHNHVVVMNRAVGREDLVPGEVLRGEKFLISCGTRPAHMAGVEYDGKYIFDSDDILHMQTDWTVPKNLIVLGGGVIGMEYASMMNAIPGSKVTVVHPAERLLGFVDQEIIESLCHKMREDGARFILGEAPVSIKKVKSTHGETKVEVQLSSGKVIYSDACMYALGRQGNTDQLNLDTIGLTPDKRGLLKVDENFMTSVENVYAAGDCIGFPALASTSMEQGRLVSCHMWDGCDVPQGEPFPYGIYTIPEVSMVGKTEEDLTREGVSYEVGVARYDGITRGHMLGGTYGLLKLLFCPTTFKLFGVHAIGEGATEIVHIGQVAMAAGLSLSYFRNSVFNYPTLAEAYRVAAINGIQKVAVPLNRGRTSMLRAAMAADQQRAPVAPTVTLSTTDDASSADDDVACSNNDVADVVEEEEEVGVERSASGSENRD
eukprot:Rmarinus@m.23752